MDAQAGVHIEGEAAPQADDEDRQAIVVWNTLHNGNGGLDWAGLPFVCEHIGVTDVDALMHRLYVIKTHKPPEQE